jgi:membrane protein
MKWNQLAALAAFAVVLGAALSRVRDPIAEGRGVVAGLASTLRADPPATRSASFVIRVFDDASRARLFSVAASVGFYALLSIVPSLAAGISLFGMFADPTWLGHAPASLSRILPAEAVQLVSQEAQRLASQPIQALSLKLGLALALSLWSASAAVRAMFDALNVIEEVEETRNIVGRYATAIAVTLGGIVILTLAAAMIGANPDFIALGPFTEETVFLYATLRWPVFFCVAVATIAALYRIGPSVRAASYVRLLPGAAFAAFIWAVGSSAFGYYVSKMANYSATYGSLATVAILMTWLWLSAAIVLLGAQLNHEINRRRR